MHEDFVQTFQIEESNLRGRILRVHTALDGILRRHEYPEQVLQLTGEAALLALLLSSMLKYDGIFTLQAQGDGPVSMVVADVSEQGHIRACAKFKDREAAAIPGARPMDLLGKGYIAFTVDQGGDTERYQGIVDLAGGSLQDSIQHYFAQSEQITTGTRMAISRDQTDGTWRAGAIMLQQLPEQKDGSDGESREDDWRRAMILLQSCKDNELLDFTLPATDLLYRLFHEDGVRAFDPVLITEQCRCSRARAEKILDIMSPEEKVEMTIDGTITVACEFCSRVYAFEQK